MKKKKAHVKQQVWQIVQLPKYMQGMLLLKPFLPLATLLKVILLTWKPAPMTLRCIIASNVKTYEWS